MCVEKLTAGHSCPKQIFCLNFLSWYLCRLFSPLRPPEEVWLKSIWKVLHSYIVPYFSINSFRRVDIGECALWTPGGPKMLSKGLEDQSFPFNTTKDIMSVFSLSFPQIPKNCAQAVWCYSVTCPFIMLLNSCVNISTRALCHCHTPPKFFEFGAQVLRIWNDQLILDRCY